MRWQRRTAIAFSLGLSMLCGTARPSRAEEIFDDLLARVPAEANALVLLNGDKLRISQVYASEIRPNPASPAEDAARLLPWSNVRRAVLAAKLDFPDARPEWEVAVFQAKRQPTLEEIIGAHNGRADKIVGEPAAWLPSETFVFLPTKDLICSVWPDDRQFAARWARRAKIASPPKFYPYLERAVGYAENVGTEIVMAIDLEGSLDPLVILKRLAVCKTLAAKKVNQQEVSDLITSIEGATLGIKFGKGIVGKLRLDFAKDPAILNDFAKPLVLEALENLGGKIDDFDTWTADIKGSTIYLSGNMSLRGLRQLMSLVSPPETDVAENAPAPRPAPVPSRPVPAPPGPASEPSTVASAGPAPATGSNYTPGQGLSDPSAKLRATKTSFNTIKSILKDLQTPDGDIITRGQYALWLERYARKLDRLPILDVDADLLAYEAELAIRLRMLAGQNKAIGIDASTATNNIDTNLGTLGNGYGWGGYGYSNSYYEARGLSSAQIAKRMGTASAAMSAVEQSQAVAAATAQMRRLLTERYRVEF